ncbi:MAG: cation-transporting P-type ATPase [Candidatus Bipolaricaulota bacterium]
METEVPLASSSKREWQPSAREAEDAVQRLQSSADGLSEDEAKRRTRTYGPNQLRETKHRSNWTLLAEQFRSLIILLLAVAAALSFVLGEWIEGIAIAAVIAINGGIGFFTELQAVRSMEALRRLSQVTTKVRRDNEVRVVPAQDLVPGDIVLLEAGEIVTADLRLLQASKVQADESTLTGESMPIGKRVDPVEPDAPIAEQSSMLFKGTAVTRGSGEALVVETGMNTELGRISSLVEEAQEEVTPLEKRLNRLGHKLIWVTLGIAGVVAVSGVLAGRNAFLMIETSIALAVAAFPDGLPIVATLTLARGMWRMAKRNALINRLSAVETLGATNVICTDKTGTLTENQMTVVRYVLPSGSVKLKPEGFSRDGRPESPSEEGALKAALEVGVLCNNAVLNHSENDESRGVGDPMEGALLAAGSLAGMHREELLTSSPEVREEAFDPEVKMMATYHQREKEIRVAVKGAPEPVLQSCTSVLTAEGTTPLDEDRRARWSATNRELAEQGLRTLALAEKTVLDAQETPYQALTLLGLVALEDPPRRDVKEAIALCKQSGIRVVMVTGDQAATSRNIALAVGLSDEQNARVLSGADLKEVTQVSPTERQRLLDAPVFARVSPKQKLDLVTLYQDSGVVCAMTGDGVNDAPALKKADIGVAMGQRGTEVARQAADMVLKDDAFPSIVAAVGQGRVIFDNMRKFVLYLLSCNVSEILAVAFASIAGIPLPILPLQILFLNLVTDVFPALALAGGEGDPGVMKRPPRDPSEPILTRGHWLAVGGYGMLITAAVLGALVVAKYGLGLPTGEAVTMSFLTLAFAQLWHVFNIRDLGTGPLANDIARNPFVWGALVLCSGLLVAAVYLPGLSAVLKTEPLTLRQWLWALAMSTFPWLVGLGVHGGYLLRHRHQQG